MRFCVGKKVLAVALAVFWLASCFNVSEASISRKPQDRLIFAMATEPLGLDPALLGDVDSGTVVCNLYESLLRFKDASVEVEPSLAERWEISEDGLVYTFYLRKGVKFHDGTPFNAQAVKFNFDRQSLQNMLPNMSYAPFVLGDVAKSEVVNEYTFRVTLKRPSTPFANNMAMSFAAPIASPTALKKYNNNLMEHPVGTGPYKLLAWDRGQSMVLTINEDYWGKKPAIQNVVIRFIKETSARVMAINNGEVDIINGIDANVVDQLKSGGSKIVEFGGNNVNYMLFNCREGYVTADREVRKAIAQAINVPELVESLYKNYAEPAHSFFPRFMMGYNPNVKTVRYDAEASKKFFLKSGIKELSILTYANARFYNAVGGQVLAEAVQSYLEKVGVKAHIEVYDWTSFRSKLLSDRWDISFFGWMTANGDPDNFISTFASKDPVANQGLWCNDYFTMAVTEAVYLPNGTERTIFYQNAEDILLEDVGILPISHAKTLMAYRPNISGSFVHPIGFIFFKNAVKKVD